MVLDASEDADARQSALVALANLAVHLTAQERACLVDDAQRAAGGGLDSAEDGIETYLTTGITNAASEGDNRLIKLEARNAFGFRNRENQRLRSRCATTRRSRREAHPH
jgi:transposase